MDLSVFSNAKIHIVGLGKTGLSAAHALRESGATITVWDDNIAARDGALQNGFNIEDVTQTQNKAFDFFLWSPGVAHIYPTPHPLAVFARANNIPLICDIDILAQTQKNADFIGITGTNGKSTTTALIHHTLSQFRKSEMGGNIGHAVLNLQSLQKNETYVLELSSYQLELTPHLNLNAALLLNITPDHLARHGGMEGYIHAKQEIFDKNNKSLAVVGIDTAPSLQIFEKLNKNDREIIPVSTQNSFSQGVYVERGKLYDAINSDVFFVGDINDIPSLKGVHNHENAACAYAVLRGLYKIDPHKIFEAMKSFGGLPHRQYKVRTISSVDYINDSKATNADATSKALACYDSIYWILGGQAKEGGLKGLENFMPRIRHAFLIGEAQNDFAEWLRAQNVAYTLCDVLSIAVKNAHDMAQNAHQSATVLLSPACASWDQFKSFEDRGDQFAHMVREL